MKKESKYPHENIQFSVLFSKILVEMHCVASAVGFSAGLGPSEAVVRGGRLGAISRSQRAYGRSKPAAASFPAISSALNAEKQTPKSTASFGMKPDMLKEAYDQCRRASRAHGSTFYSAIQLLVPETRKAILAITAWCRRIDELVDGPSASSITPSDLDDWESRLEDIFAGHPYDLIDAALLDTVTKYQIDIQLFKDVIKGMRMDLEKSRYNNFNELYHFCYCVSGAVAVMIIPMIGIAPKSEATAESFYNSVLDSGIATQLANILRDVGEDARRGRIYLPQDELAQAGLSDEDIFNGKVTDKWRHFMKHQIARARMFFDEAEKGVSYLNQACRWPAYAGLLLYKKILDEIEANDYDTFTKRASVSTAKKLMTVFTAYQRLLIGPSPGN